MHVAFAERCAWRAVYVYQGTRQLGHIGIDPRGSSGPEVFVSLGRRHLRFTLPHLRWRYPHGRVWSWAYGLQGRILLRIDSRFKAGRGGRVSP